MPRTTEGTRAPHRRSPLDGDHGRARRLGNDALRFARWFFRSKYALMAGFLGELEQTPEARDERDLRQRYCRALRHAMRVQRARAVVTVLLAMGVLTASSAAVLDALAGPEGRALVQDVAAWSASISVLLVGLRLAFDRYLGLVDVSATFLAMQLATARPRA